MLEDGGLLQDLVELTEKATNKDELRRTIETILEQYGLRHVVYHSSRIPGELDRQPIIICTYPQKWIDRYLESHYFQIDPVVRFGVKRVLPIDWSHLPRTSPVTQRFFGEAYEPGIGRHGMTFPVRGPCGERALFSITSDTSDSEWRQDRLLYARDLHILAYCFHHRAIVLNSANHEFPILTLSTRQRQCLHLLAVGRAPKQIASDLSISESAVRLYISSARQKLRCINTNHAISRATHLGVIRSL